MEAYCMKAVAIVSQKGGVGKTTLASHLAVKAASEGHSVGIIDLDPQGSLSAWAASREAEQPYFIVADGALKTQMKKLAQGGFDFIFIDTPPNSINTFDEMQAADFFLIPVKASPHDLRTIPATWERIQEKEKAAFVLNDVTPRSRIAWDSLQTLSQLGAVAGTITSRVTFAESQIDGRTIQEIEPKGKGAAEIGKIYRFLMEKLQQEEESL
jgi:chromosome partitioning protein